MGDMKLNLIRILYEFRHKQTEPKKKEKNYADEFIFRDFFPWTRKRKCFLMVSG